MTGLIRRAQSALKAKPLDYQEGAPQACSGLEPSSCLDHYWNRFVRVCFCICSQN